MKRREFLQFLGLGLGAGCLLRRLPWVGAAQADLAHAALPGVRLALLADAHLQDGQADRPEAQALARAVAEIRAWQPAPDMVLLAGDLAHRGDPRALSLGREILSDLPSPLVAVMGEGDGLPDAAGPWRQLFGEPWFSRNLGGLQVLGLHTAWCPGPGGPVFQVGEAGYRWLARELAHLDQDTPLLILSHAPLAQVFHPWQQWTADAGRLTPLLAPFRQVLCLHGHVHQSGVRGQGLAVRGQGFGIRGLGFGAQESGFGIRDSGFGVRKEMPGGQWPASESFCDSDESYFLETENHLSHQGIPATAWPLPTPLQGTPVSLRPGQGPRGCGWGLLTLAPDAWQFHPQDWLA